MRLSDEAKMPVRPREFWGAVAGAVVLIGVFVTQTGHTPGPGLWLWGGALSLVWTVALWHLFRFGRRAFSWRRVAFLVGFTLFVGGGFWPHPPAAVSWAAAGGTVLMMAELLSPYFVFGKQAAEKAEPGPVG